MTHIIGSMMVFGKNYIVADVEVMVLDLRVYTILMIIMIFFVNGMKIGSLTSFM